jgi:crotonobetainyl-CoA:carnitine CoA-transferase CaiB-like acyl-CoA transferase
MNATTGSPSLPLDGLRVVDLTRVLAGPLCTMTLADLGADVIKVERPVDGDDTRHWGPPFAGDDAAYFLALNRNKRSIALDLADPDDADTLRRLIARSDVLIENFRPGLLTRFGLDLAALRSAHPRLVTCSLTAFADGVPGSATRPGYDIIVQALCGLMSVTGERDGEPTKAGVALLDVVTGLQATIGILSAVRERDRTGAGGHVGVALFDASVAAMVNQAANYLIGGVVPRAMGNEHPNIVPYQVFHATDRPFVLAAGNDRLYARTCEVVGLPQLADDPRFATNGARVDHREILIPMLAEAFRREDAATWLARLDGAGVPCSPILSMDEVFASPEGSALIGSIGDPVRGPLGLVANPVRIDGRTVPTRMPPPRLDEHGEEIRAELDASGDP